MPDTTTTGAERQLGSVRRLMLAEAMLRESARLLAELAHHLEPRAT